MNTAIQPCFKAMILLVWIFLLVPLLSLGQEILDMPKSTHFVANTPQSKLVVVKEILPDFDKDLFLAVPSSIAANKAGFIYVYDNKLVRVFIFNSKFEYVGQFMDHGIGPGEVLPQHGMNKKLYVGDDDRVYVHDGHQDKLVVFSAEGEFISEIKSNRRRKTQMPFTPVVDKDGFIYSYSVNNGIIDRSDAKMKVVHTYLDIALNGRYVVYKPPFEEYYLASPLKKYAQSKPWLLADMANTSYDITKDGMLFVFLHRSSTAYFFKGDRLVRQFDILIDRVLPDYRRGVEDMIKEKKKRSTGVGLFQTFMFTSCFVDHDEPYFYLQSNSGSGESFALYQMDFSGKLVHIYRLVKEIPMSLHTKRNGQFYGLVTEDRHPIILKKEVK